MSIDTRLIGFGKDIEKNLLEAASPFVFSSGNERSILRLGRSSRRDSTSSIPGVVLKLIVCDNDKIGTYAKLVDDRNEELFFAPAPRRPSSRPGRQRLR